ncbi:hypothetical protein AB0O01_27340 [Streptomyces sp. NPDC093252]|uniref:hypothetical protein n=1 Tax=Streptomyces sp. NPDC093252 TaxID=3154980 RepID=UPI003423DA71
MTAPLPPLPPPRAARAGRDLRILRAAVFAAVCVVLSAVGHVIASCAAVPLWALGTGFVGVLAVAVPLAGRRRSLGGIAGLLAVGQLALHGLFGLGQHRTAEAAAEAARAAADASLVERAARLVCGTTAAALSPAEAQRVLTEARLMPGAGGAHHPGDPVPGGADAAVSGVVSSSGVLLPSLPMLLGHVLAALAAGWLLRRGDLALLRLIDLSAQGVERGRGRAEMAPVRALRMALALVRALCAGLPAAPGNGPRAVRATDFAPPEPCAEALQHSVVRRGPPAPAYGSAAYALAV